MRRAIAASACAAMLLAGPADGSELASQMGATTAVVNRDGFAAFAAFGRDETDVVTSPLLTWYVHRFLSLRSRDASARAFVTLLRRSGVAIDATVHAARGRSGYTDAVASYERDDLGVDTKWDLGSSPRDFAWTFEADISTHDDFLVKSSADLDLSFLRAPFSARDGIRAVRLDAANRSRSLFVFFGTQAALTDLRKRMSPELWQTVSTRFATSELVISNFVVRRRSGTRVPVEVTEGFGSFAAPMTPRDGSALVALAASLDEASMSAHAALQGYATDYGPSDFRPVDVPPSVHYVAVPPERRLSAIVPMLYVLEDTRTGAIILLGTNA
jgi:hypothetical protein